MNLFLQDGEPPDNVQDRGLTMNLSTDSSTRLALRALLLAGLVAGALDISAAILVNLLRDIPPVRILQSVASGLLGREAYAGGAMTATLGLALHFAMMFVIAGVYLGVSRPLSAALRHPFVAGPVYGIAVYVVMTFIVLPLSAFPHPMRTEISAHLIGLAVHVTCVGLPIAFFMWGAWERRPGRSQSGSFETSE